MCGFVGFYTRDNQNDNRAILKQMNDMIKHRGPDSEGYYVDGNLNFGFRRLSIIDITQEGDQPIVSEDENFTIVFNGEVYNYKEIRKELEEKGYTFKTHTDTEVILKGYEAYGEEGILEKLRGMFAFTIWDKKEKKVFGARDHFGIKPYYYTNVDGDLLFASEIKAFLKYPKFEKKINKKALKNFLVFQYNPLEETFFEGVKKLRPGHYYTYKDGKFEIKKYFNLELDYKNITMEKSIEAIDKAVDESIKYHKISDVEVGSFLSGGVDSSYVLSKADVSKSFSVGFANRGFDETIYAKELSEIKGVENHSKIIEAEEFFDILPKVQYFSDEPHANLSAVPLFFLSKMAREHVKVVLSGEGADELFAGYNIYEKHNVSKMYSMLPFGIRNKLYKKYKDKPHFRGKTIITRYGEKPEKAYIGQAEIMKDEEANSILKNQYKNEVNSFDLCKKYYDEVKDMDDDSKKMFLDMNLWIVEDILLKADKMTMANSLELRVPFLDRGMWEVARKMPIKHKMAKGTSKYAFRQSAFKVLPKEWAKRRKVGFLVPFRDFIKEDKYYNKVKEMFNQDFAEEFFDLEKINKMLDDHYNGVENTARKVYTIYSFLLWYQEYFVKEI